MIKGGVRTLFEKQPVKITDSWLQKISLKKYLKTLQTVKGFKLQVSSVPKNKIGVLFLGTDDTCNLNPFLDFCIPGLVCVVSNK